MNYAYDKVTLVYTGVGELILDPLETEKKDRNIYLRPAHSTLTPPPEKVEGMVARFNKVTNSWDSVEDNRGEHYWLEGDARRYTQGELGPLPGLTEASLDVLRGQAWYTAKSKRQSVIEAPLEYNGATYDVDRNSIANFKEAIYVLTQPEAPTSKRWITADNLEVTLEAADIHGIVQAYIKRKEEAYLDSQTERVRIKTKKRKEL